MGTLGSGAPNAAYLGQRLQYGQGEDLDISEFLTQATKIGPTIRQAVIWLILPVIPVLLLAFIILGSGPATVLGVIAVFGAVFVALSPLFKRHYQVVSEWKLSLDGKGSIAEDVFDHVAAALVRRRSPVLYRAMPLYTGRLYLNLRLGTFDAYISCWAFGDDLYIGWSLWSTGTWRLGFWQRVLGILFMPFFVLHEVLASRRHQSLDVAALHDSDALKAMRECLHAVTREGVQAASGVVAMVPRGTIGSIIPTDGSFGGQEMGLFKRGRRS